MGAGKSTVGLLLSRQLKRPFFDTDHEVQRRTGVDVSWIFDLEGEAGFRDRETMALRELIQHEGAIISTGGGTVVREENRKLISENGHVIFLTTDFDEQVKRTARNRYKRPSLRVNNIEEKIQLLLDEREPLYREIADATFLSNQRRVTVVVKEIVKFIKERDW